jgi:YbbR domain-containing protein
MILNFDTTDPDSINDAFEVALVDAQGNSLIHTIQPNRDAFFNITEEPTLRSCFWSQHCGNDG